jgi:hypothetical protein
MGESRQAGEGDAMTRNRTRPSIRRAFAHVAGAAALAVGVAAIVMAPAAAETGKPRPKLRAAQESATVQDVSGLSVTRTWRIAKDDPNTLVAKITAQNTSSAPITTSIVEPIPTASLKRITFTPLKMHTSSIPGLGRYDITVPAGGNLTFGYTAHLAKDRKTTAQNRLATVKHEMEATLPGAQATDADRAIAAMKDRYVGPVALTDFNTTGLGHPPEPPAIGPGSISLRLTTTPTCRVVGRGCRFPAQDSFTSEPKLSGLEPMGNALVANGSVDLADSGLTCAGVADSGLMVKSWTFEPTAWRLSWAGWEVTQGQYTIVADLTSPANGRCTTATVHFVFSGAISA